VLCFEGYGFDKMGVKIIECGVIEVDECGCINVDGVWVIGDVIGKLMLVYMVEVMGIVMVEMIVDYDIIEIDFDMILWVMYC